MNNPPRDENHKDLECQAKSLYKSIKQVLRPPWNEYISFNTDGFRHLIWKGKYRRAEKEQKERLNLLPYASEIITSGRGWYQLETGEKSKERDTMERRKGRNRGQNFGLLATLRMARKLP